MKQTLFTVQELVSFLGDSTIVIGDLNSVFTNVKPINEAASDSLVWLNPNRIDKLELITNTVAKIIICSNDLDHTIPALHGKTFIKVHEPKLSFLRVVEHFFTAKMTSGIHPTAIIDTDAIIGSDVFIGPNCIIGKVKLGSGSIIKGNVVLHDNTVIGNNVIVHPGAVIGADGFGYVRNGNGEFEKFPHVGGVVIEDNVEIGSNTCIDRGTLGNTLIKQGAKIDNLVHIAHNVIIGKHSAVIANAMVAGSTIVGDFTWVAPSASIQDAIVIGDHVTVGIGAVVTKSVESNQTVVGSPAQPIKSFINERSAIKSIVKQKQS